MLQGRRVVIVNWRDPWHSLAGGSERYAWEFALAMRERGAEVDFLTAQDRGQVRHERIDGIEVRRRGGTFTFYAWVWWALLRRRFSRRRWDVVVDAENGIPVFAPLVAGRKTLVVLVMHHVHQEQFRTYFSRPLSEVGRFLEGRLMPRVYRRRPTIAVSDSTVAEMRSQIGWTQPVTVIANGAEPAPVPHVVSDTTDRLLVLGRLATHKRIDLVVRAVAKLRAERPRLRLDIVGQGPEGDRLAALVASLGLSDAVTLHGFLPADEKVAIAEAARLHICASDAEGWGQVVVETASFGLPTVARDVPGLRDSVRPGETGWLLPDTEGEDDLLVTLADGMRDALDELDDDQRRAEMAAACRAWADRFSWPRMRQEVGDLVSRELAGR